MTHIFKKICSAGKLRLYIRELDYPEKEYEGFRLKLNDGEWVEIENNLSDDYETSSVLFENLDINTRHTAYGQIKKTGGEWIDLQSAIFAVQSDIVNIPYTSRHIGTGTKTQFEEPIIITNESIDIPPIEKETIIIEDMNEIGDL